MPITILDYVKFQIGEKDTYPAEDFYSTCVDIMGGCEGCSATIAAYNAYPSKSGYWRCADCIGGSGFATVEEFMNSGAASQQQTAPEDENDPDDIEINCPVCDAIENIKEIRDRTFECGFCAAVWSV